MQRTKTVDLPNRHDRAIERQHFYVCNNCKHWQVFVWHDAIGDGKSQRQCWTCGSKDVRHSSQRPINTPTAKLRKLGIRKLTALLEAKGIRV